MADNMKLVKPVPDNPKNARFVYDKPVYWYCDKDECIEADATANPGTSKHCRVCGKERGAKE